MNENTVVAFDIDGTLLDCKEDFPRYEIINLLIFFIEHTNCQVVIWSGGGVDYAERWTYKLGFEGKVKVLAKGSIKPDLVFDDFPSDDPHFAPKTLGKLNIRV